MRKCLPIHFICFFAAATAGLLADEGAAVKTELIEVVAKPLSKTMVIPGELAPYRRVEVHSKVTGFVEEILVDRGSFVQKGQALARLSAPELEAQRLEAQAKIPAVVAQRIEAEARLAAAESTFQRLSEAAKTPGVVAGNDVVLAEKAVDAERARIDSYDKTVEAYEASVRAIQEIEKYLTVVAPFSGVITERYAHEGALVGPQGESGVPLLILEQMDRLRLIAAVPESYRQSISRNRRVQFTTPAFPSETFTGVVSRPAFAIASKTRTMPVELDVANPERRLTPGMYAEVQWPISRGNDSLFVPPSAIQATTERIFVIRVSNGKAEWIDVRRGMMEGDLVEIFGDVRAGDRIVKRATDEIRPGFRVVPVQSPL